MRLILELELMLNLARSVKVIHNTGIIINNLSLESIRVKDNGEIVICDFSLGVMKDKA